MSDRDIASWLIGRLPAEWTSAGPPAIAVDREEITIVLALAVPELPADEPAGGAAPDDAAPDDPASDDAASDGPASDGPAPDAADVTAAIDGRVVGFREDTRDRRMRIAREAEHRFDRKVSWGVAIGDRRHMFTHLAAPVMTRLRQPERIVLDTLVAANVARSRSDALAWCVRLVGRNVDEWLADLRHAMEAVDDVRAAGPDV